MKTIKSFSFCLFLFVLNISFSFAQTTPVANDDFFTIHRSGLLNVLANDQPSSGISASIVTLPPSSEGTISGVSGGYTFTATLGFIGTTSFTYRACNATVCNGNRLSMTDVLGTET